MRKSVSDEIKRHLRAEDSRFITSRSPFYHTVRMLARYYTRMNAVLKPSGIDVARWRVLILLAERDVMTISEIAEESVVHISTMTKTITRMAGQGLVAVRTSSTDARATEVMVTPAGRKLLEQTREQVKGVFKDALRGLSKTEVQLLNSLSARVFENLEP
ncbi:MAG: MarR family transcriptional regulator [Xanthobacteraceae bacterium]|nr:MarR family transcriptional regulator [Xanthobacteraceae bacterium]